MTLTTTPITIPSTSTAPHGHVATAVRFAGFRRDADLAPPSWEPSRRPMLAPLPG